MAAGIDNATGVQFAAGQSYADNVMTNVMRDLMADARNNSTPAWNLMKKEPHETVGGNFIVWATHTGRNIGVNSIRDTGDMPDPGAQGYKTQSVNTRMIYGRVKIDGSTLRRSRKNNGALRPADVEELAGQAEDFAVYQNRVCHGDGSGRLAEVASISTTTITLKLNTELPGASSVAGNFMGLRNFEINDRVAFITADGATLSGSATQNAYYVVTRTATTIQVALTPGGAAADLTAVATPVAADQWIVRASNDGVLTKVSTGFRSEPNGFAGILGASNIFDGNGLSAAQQQGSNAADTIVALTTVGAGFQGNAADLTNGAGNTWNRAVVLDNGGVARAFDFPLMQQCLSDIEEANNANVSLIISPYKQFNDAVNLTLPDKRYNNTTRLETGVTMLDWNGLPWYKDRYCLPGRIMFVAMDQYRVMETEPLTPIRPMDMPQWERLANKDAVWCGFMTQYNMVVNVRERAGGILVDLTAT
jgi:hypothetical protein